MKRLKSITAGLLHYDFLVPLTVVPGSTKQRGPRLKPSSAAQSFMNLKNSWRQCELMIAANFGQEGKVLTLTYDDAHLPASKVAADRLLYDKFIRDLRAVRRRRGQDLQALYVTEGLHGICSYDGFMDDTDWEDHRLHHHMVINGVGPGDLDEIRSLWPYGCYIRLEPLDIHYYRELAKYLTKEAREFGRGRPGERTWRCTRNLRKPQVEYENDVPDNLTLTPPPGAVDIEHLDKPNPEGYGEFICTRYLLLPEPDPPHYSYNLGRHRRR